MCEHCGAAVFRGLDEVVMAFPVTVDARPISALGEVVALLNDRRTYTLGWRSALGRYEIDRRDKYEIERHPAGENVDFEVVPEHQCGAPPLPPMTSFRRARRSRGALPIDPPF
jgi:hypothetical protein